MHGLAFFRLFIRLEGSGHSPKLTFSNAYHSSGENWLYPEIVSAFRLIHQRTREGGGVNAMVLNPVTLEPLDVTSVRLYSVEVWNAETGALAGGELGYSVGGIYSSLTGFSNEDNAGSVQLGALGKLLMECGFKYWDLGMGMEYKTQLGAEMMRRSDFLDRVHRTRVEDKLVVLRCDGRRSAKELIDSRAPRPELRPAAAGAVVGQIPNNVEIEDGNPQGGGRELEQPRQDDGSQQRHHNRPMAQPQPQQAHEPQRRQSRPAAQHRLRDPPSPDRKPRAREEVLPNESTTIHRRDSYDTDCSSTCSRASRKKPKPCDSNLDMSDRSNKQRRVLANSTDCVQIKVDNSHIPNLTGAHLQR